MRLEARLTLLFAALMGVPAILHLLGLAEGRYAHLLVTVPLVFGLALFVWVLRRHVLKPLAQIADAARRFGGGDLSVRLPTFAGSELAEVSVTFNEMARALQERSADLSATVAQLRSNLEELEEVQALLATGAGIGEVLVRAAENLGTALHAAGVGIWRAGASEPEARWGSMLPSRDAVALAIARSSHHPCVLHAKSGPDGGIAWAVTPARRDDRVLGAVGVVWSPPEPLDEGRRDLLVGLTGLVGVAMENVDLIRRLREEEESLQGLLRKTLTAQEEERRRISRELHDETSQVLSALMMNIDLLGNQVGVSESSRVRIEAVKALAEEAARNLDKMMLELRPALLDELGLIAALRWYAAQVGDLWSVPVEFDGHYTGRLPDPVEVAAFRIVQEAVSNCVRHSKASRIRVRVTVDETSLHLEVSDDGIGFDVAAESARARSGEAVGLMGMRERAELVGGTLTVSSTIGVGTTVAADIPLLAELKAGRP
ncbi:MAG TPA: ATP-binding protein [Actinomycetota bacterium]|jgi:signal transduction histidine kinase|nr:ATP-binding protein [Actinomycetota bacterium]